jgi:hypothetical protein
MHLPRLSTARTLLSSGPPGSVFRSLSRRERVRVREGWEREKCTRIRVV